MKIIVGLGNIGSNYKNTRHNIGFMVIDTYLAKYNITNKKEKFNGEYYDIFIGAERVILLKPNKYMNLSGEVLRDYMSFFKVPIEDILIIQDDLDLPCGKIRLRLNGSNGGHNGIKDIEKNIGGSNFKRIKIGISNDSDIDTKDYVLGKFNNEEKKLVKNSVDIAVQIIEQFPNNTFESLMNKYN